MVRESSAAETNDGAARAQFQAFADRVELVRFGVRAHARECEAQRQAVAALERRDITAATYFLAAAASYGTAARLAGL